MEEEKKYIVYKKNIIKNSRGLITSETYQKYELSEEELKDFTKNNATVIDYIDIFEKSSLKKINISYEIK